MSGLKGDLFAATTVTVDGTVVAKGVMFAMAIEEYSSASFSCWLDPWSGTSVPLTLQDASKVVAYQGLGA